ncbi:MAG: hypothetical protein C5B56_07790 [Proteobacteria bacterium]|nr:MAG: hypothetical protein C5B56_07790 [Pseudomonadota bacterium]
MAAAEAMGRYASRRAAKQMTRRNYGSMYRLGAILAIAATSVLPTWAQTNGAQWETNMTLPFGGVWVQDSSGGHYWTPDGVNGLQRVRTGGGGFDAADGTVKSGGQIAKLEVGTPGTSTFFTYLFVPDNSRLSAAVVRYKINNTGSVAGNLVINVPNTNNVGGGAAGGGRATAAAVDAAGNLYVGYKKSGDIVKVAAVDAAGTSTTPPVQLVASTSDGRGVNALIFFGNDMYLAEIGGFGLSMIQDPSGVNRAACNAAAPCTAASLNPQVSFFPGGLATDQVSIYIGDSPFTNSASILKYTPGAGTLTTYSTNISPSYTATIGGITKTYTQYFGAIGLGLAPNGDLYVGDDPSFSFIPPAGAAVPTGLGHIWKIAFPGAPLSISGFTPATGPDTGGTTVTITGTGFALGGNGTTFKFGTVLGTNVNCTTVTTCTVRTPQLIGGGTVNITATVGATSVVSGAQFSFTATGSTGTAPAITAISPNIGLPAGGTTVTITGTNFTGVSRVIFGLAGQGTLVGACSATSCTVTSPAFAGTGVVDIQLQNGGLASAVVPADKFTYSNPVATLYAWGITAPKGGMTFVPGNLGGHMWSSDHAQGFCRHDSMTSAKTYLWPSTPTTWPGSQTLHSMNSAICDNGSIGSPGQAVYDPRVNGAFTNSTTGVAVPAGTHFIYVPDNAVKSTAVWRLTFDPNTESIVGAPEAMVPLADVRTLKPNGMALGPDGNLYITDLTETNIRRLTGPNGDPRLQTIGIVAVTGDGRGANGTIAFAGLPGDTGLLPGTGMQYQNVLVISENRAASFFDVTACPTLAGPCTTTPIPMPSGVFVAGVAVDPVRHLAYIADSPGGANATIWRYNLNLYDPTGLTNPAIAYLTGGKLPAAGTPEQTVWISQTGVRPWNPAYVPGGTAGFSFTFGLSVVSPSGDLFITGDPTAGARGGFGTAWVAKLIQ